MMINSQNDPQQQGQPQTEPKSGQLSEEDANYRLKLMDQMWTSIRAGKNTTVDLAKPLRDEIVEEYRNDESPKIKNSQYLEDMTILCINMSLPTVQRTIDQMENFKSIETLIITGGKKSGAPVNLDDLLKRAAKYPLKQLYIVGFKSFVTQIPRQVSTFTNLNLLSFVGDQIAVLPPEMGNLSSLKVLYIDINPVTSVLPIVRNLHQLEKLGVGKTNIPQSELDIIKQTLPNCNILLK
ncbi:MAG: hypothetical protein GZ094_06265 [Mariniphaga sp.]|nr:hypothetical protein [Mariniphaga sp.]